jgi:hypothetical protein
MCFVAVHPLGLALALSRFFRPWQVMMSVLLQLLRMAIRWTLLRPTKPTPQTLVVRLLLSRHLDSLRSRQLRPSVRRTRLSHCFPHRGYLLSPSSVLLKASRPCLRLCLVTRPTGLVVATGIFCVYILTFLSALCCPLALSLNLCDSRGLASVERHLGSSKANFLPFTFTLTLIFDLGGVLGALLW